MNSDYKGGRHKAPMALRSAAPPASCLGMPPKAWKPALTYAVPIVAAWLSSALDLSILTTSM